MINIILGIASIIIGVLLIKLYADLVKQKKQSNLSMNFIAAGVGLILIGIYLLAKCTTANS